MTYPYNMQLSYATGNKQYCLFLGHKKIWENNAICSQSLDVKKKINQILLRCKEQLKELAIG